VLVAIIIVAVLVLLVVVMRWADRRDRAKGHVNRRAGDLRSAIGAGKEKKLKTQLKQPRGPLGY
jgi:hypothetical protein